MTKIMILGSLFLNHLRILFMIDVNKSGSFRTIPNSRTSNSFSSSSGRSELFSFTSNPSSNIIVVNLVPHIIFPRFPSLSFMIHTGRKLRDVFGSTWYWSQQGWNSINSFDSSLNLYIVYQTSSDLPSSFLSIFRLSHKFFSLCCNIQSVPSIQNRYWPPTYWKELDLVTNSG